MPLGNHPHTHDEKGSGPSGGHTHVHLASHHDGDPDPVPVLEAGEHRSYVTEAEVRDVLAIATGQDERVLETAIAATLLVDQKVGGTLPEGWDNVLEHPVTLSIIPAVAQIRQATLLYAARVWASAGVPFGVLGGFGENSDRTPMSVPEADVLLLGLRETWGVA